MMKNWIGAALLLALTFPLNALAQEATERLIGENPSAENTRTAVDKVLKAQGQDNKHV